MEGVNNNDKDDGDSDFTYVSAKSSEHRFRSSLFIDTTKTIFHYDA